MFSLFGRARKLLDRLDIFVIFGGGKDILKPKKTGKPVVDFLEWIDYHVLLLLDKIDTRFIFKGRAVRTEVGRVRSRGERKIVHFFLQNGIRFAYEPLLVLGGKELHPDFYLPQFGVYVEFWGMADISQRYRGIMQAKKRLFTKHQIPVVSVYPRHLNDLQKAFPALLEKATGKPFLSKGGDSRG